MRFLDTVLEKNIRLIDYECVVSPDSPASLSTRAERLLHFGVPCGNAGMINSLRGLGVQLLNRGYHTPFLHVPAAHMLKDKSSALNVVHRAGDEIRKYGLPQGLSPLRFVFNGDGHVSQGAQEVFKQLPHMMVAPEELATVTADSSTLIGCVVTEEHTLRNASTTAPTFSTTDFLTRPSDYRSVYNEDIVPHANVIINAIYWDPRFPRLLTKDDLKHSSTTDNNHLGLLVVGDLSCDIEGGIEFSMRTTNMHNPFYLYSPRDSVIHDSLMDGGADGIMMMGIDNLPAEMPEESSNSFGRALLKYVNTMATSDIDEPIASDTKLAVEIKRACIADGGKLTDTYQYIQNVRAVHESRTQTGEAEGATSTVMLTGHLFDTGLINQALDVIEQKGAGFKVKEMIAQPNPLHDATKQKSTAILEIQVQSSSQLLAVVDELRMLCSQTEFAEASLETL